MEPIEFITARLDEDEATARAAMSSTSGIWRWNHGFGDMCNDPSCPFGELTASGSPHDTVLMQVHGYDVSSPWEGAAHIARHDPARALREVDAKRRLLFQFEHRGNAVRGLDGCETGGVWDDLIRMLALPYADHPGYRQEWTP